jgi:ABC-type nitrate/sulfonate/bicarbonate transport system substrate-binding protein
MDIVRIILRFHSLFYAPHFVAMYLGVLAQAGLRVEVRTANSGRELADALLTGEADLNLNGSVRGLDLAQTGGRDRVISIIIDGGFICKRYPYVEHINVEFAQRRCRVERTGGCEC